MRIYVITILLVALFFSCAQDTRSDPGAGPRTGTVQPLPDTVRFAGKAREALAYARARKMSTNRCILIDMSVHSGLNRLVEWDFKTGSIRSATLVTHGCGTAAWAADHSRQAPQFSNVPESHLSSLGRYRIGARGPSQWGIGVKYLLHGLDTTNNNALKRYIVLHSWDKVQNREVYPSGAPESWGCPAVSDAYMTYLDTVLQNEKRPVLLWIYY